MMKAGSAAAAAAAASVGEAGAASAGHGADAAGVDAKLKRLHSLLFGSENALAAADSETALGLALRLLGFLGSESKTAEDEAYICKMLKVVHSTVDTARRGLNSGREAQERTRSDEPRFSAHSCSIDLQRIKNSKYFSSVYRTPDKTPDELSASRDGATAQLSRAPSMPTVRSDLIFPRMENEKGAERRVPISARGMMQSKITNYGGNGVKPSGNQYVLKAESSENCRVPCRRLSAEAVEPYAPAAKHSLPSEPVAKATTSKSVPRRTADIVDSDFIPAPDDEEDDKSLWNSYGSGRKRGRNSYLHKKAQTKTRGGFRNDDSDDEFGERAPKVSSYITRKKQETMKQLQKKEECGSDSEDDVEDRANAFVTAKQKWAMESLCKRMSSSNPGGSNSFPNGGNASSNGRNGAAKSLGVRRGVRGNFVPPVRFNGGSTSGAAAAPRQQHGGENGVEDSTKKCLELLVGPDGELPERLRNLEPKLIEHVSNEIMEQDPNVRWDDIAGLEHAKKCVTEMVIWPLLRPDIFQGCRAPGKGLLLFGPPGTGKTMIGKAIAGEARATFFSISASSLTSKWIGEGEKLVRALFGVASCRQPAVIFIDEVDSLLSQRKAEGEHESSRRLKTQFLIEMEGCGSGTEQILLIATNRPQELDEAARRRLSKRLYIPLPSAAARAWIVRSLLNKDGLMTLSDDEVETICTRTDGYSGSDMKNLVKEASMGPLREALTQGKDISKISNDEMRSISLQDFMSALQQVRASVSQHELGLYEDWNKQFGSLAL
ncbi:fidgetin-like protein 1 [Marchantia polymorpha subsp. ruderalis]|uniref:AAA+ ATPase domain-containing protein n=2 Tax=Marchantia polymorpha TaxID=3197 RepID=A0AAF6BN33_MARPO|nr:hypothetical protein MARPO_0035s0108 [Marchantia polymorpha]BBN13417.1 hypothetical protein Mp_6g03280 [Marchantia polymorpha subsp. ruderalis]|eukprot:PTQ41337.1 hypothetical protein MARPO_0035s0108 [Marchantia polymorpha]